MKRRHFLAAVVGAGLGAAAAGHAEEQKMTGTMARRPYGKTGEMLSLVGLGGIVVSQVEQSEANDTVAWAVDQGVNYVDVAPSYGNAQERLGPALKPYRDRCFLACKTAKRDAAGAQAELEESLRLLQTDHFDLYQLHGLTKVEEVEKALGPGGAMEVILKAREEGKIRHIGFSAHSVEAAFKALESFPFESALFPLNAVCIENGGFGKQILDKVQEKGAVALALKALAWTPWPTKERKYPKCWYQPQDDPAVAELLLRYTLDLPIVAAVPPGDGRLFRLAVGIAQRYRPLEAAERAELMERIKGVKPIFAAT